MIDKDEIESKIKLDAKIRLAMEYLYELKEDCTPTQRTKIEKTMDLFRSQVLLGVEPASCALIYKYIQKEIDRLKK